MLTLLIRVHVLRVVTVLLRFLALEVDLVKVPMMNRPIFLIQYCNHAISHFLRNHSVRQLLSGSLEEGYVSGKKVVQVGTKCPIIE